MPRLLSNSWWMLALRGVTAATARKVVRWADIAALAVSLEGSMAISNAFFETWRPRALAVLRQRESGHPLARASAPAS